MCSDMNDPHFDNSSPKITIVHATDHPRLFSENIICPSLFIDDAHGFELIRPDKTIIGTERSEDGVLPDDCCVCRHFDLCNLQNSADSIRNVEGFIEEIKN